MKLRGRRTGRAAAAAALSLLVLSGCGGLPPGTAAKVNDTRITDDQVTDLADAQCRLQDDLVKGGNAPVVAVSQVRQQALSLLIDTQLSQQFGKSEGIRPDALLVRGFLGQVEPFFENLPQQVRDELTDVFTDWAGGRAVLVQAGSEATGEKISLEKTEQLLNAGLAEREKWLNKEADIETDPRYSPNEQGFPGGGDGSVSRPSSDFAKAADADQPNPDWVSGLPENQKCG